jgi:predicted enzyme related to lactoylglutathione lyase
MITGVHALIYSDEAEKLRAFFRDVLEAPHVDAGHGWLIFALPPAELGIHPKNPNDSRKTTHEFYLMCDDINATVEELQKRGVEFARPIADQGFGLMTAIKLPGGGELGMYQPKHPLPPRT